MATTRFMQFKNKTSFANGLALFGFSLISLFLISLQVLHYFHPGNVLSLAIGPFLTGLLITVFFVGMGYYLNKISYDIEFFSIRELTAFMLGLGLVALMMNSLPALFGLFNLHFVSSGVVGIAYHALLLVFIVFFFMAIAVLAKRLLMARSKPMVSKAWKTFLIVLLISNIFNFYGFDFSRVFFFIVLGLGAITGFFVLTRMDWIAMIERQSRWPVLLFVFVLNGISLSLTLRLIDFGLAGAFHIYFTQNVFLLLLVGFVDSFALLSFLGILFHLPIAGYIEEKNHQIDTFRQISMQSRNVDAGSQTANFELLLQAAMKNSFASAAWIAEVDKHHPGDKVLAAENIDPKDIKRIEYTVFNHPAHFDLDKDVNYSYVKDMSKDFYLSDHGLPFLSLVVFPIRIDTDHTYRLYLVRDIANGFEAYTIQLIQAYIEQTRMAVFNQFMMKDTIEAERIKKDFEIGKKVQQDLLPALFPEHPSFSAAGISIPAEEVGGDYFDYHRFDENRFAFILADVSGKGTSAAFHVAEMKGIFQSLILGETDPAGFMKKANDAVGKCFEKGMFITVIYALLDLEKNELKYSRAGHCPLIYFDAKQNKIIELKDEGLGLGIIRDKSYHDMVTENRIALNTGDIILMYTDGISEERHAETREEYGYDRIHDMVFLNLDQPARNLASKIVQDVQSFSGKEHCRDDMSLLVIRINSKNG
jgi:phosphoserine phosphatase RsbU/P